MSIAVSQERGCNDLQDLVKFVSLDSVMMGMTANVERSGHGEDRRWLTMTQFVMFVVFAVTRHTRLG